MIYNNSAPDNLLEANEQEGMSKRQTSLFLGNGVFLQVLCPGDSGSIEKTHRIVSFVATIESARKVETHRFWENQPEFSDDFCKQIIFR